MSIETTARPLTYEQRMSDDYLAAAMYEARVKQDSTKHPDMHDRNPDAQRLYYKGIQDTITNLRALGEAGVDQEAISGIIAKLFKQAKAIK